MTTATPRRRAHGEDGFALELSLIFLTAIAVIVASLIGFANTSSQSTTLIRSTRGADYDADAAVQADIAIIRVTAGQGVYGLTCASYNPSTTSPTFVLNNTAAQLRVDCTPVGITSRTPEREVVLSVCPSSVTAPCPDASALVRVAVIFYDDVTFGRALSIESWSNQ